MIDAHHYSPFCIPFTLQTTLIRMLISLMGLAIDSSKVTPHLIYRACVAKKFSNSSRLSNGKSATVFSCACAVVDYRQDAYCIPGRKPQQDRHTQYVTMVCMYVCMYVYVREYYYSLCVCRFHLFLYMQMIWTRASRRAIRNNASQLLVRRRQSLEGKQRKLSPSRRLSRAACYYMITHYKSIILLVLCIPCPS